MSGVESGAQMVRVMSNGGQIDVRADTKRGRLGFEAHSVMPAGSTEVTVFYIAKPMAAGTTASPDRLPVDRTEIATSDCGHHRGSSTATLHDSKRQ